MNRNKMLACLIFVIVSFAVATYFYPLMPIRIASHWGINGQADGYSSKFVGLFIMPFLTAFIFLLFLLIPKIDPLRKNVEKFKGYFENFMIVIVGFLTTLQIYIVLWNLGIQIPMELFMAPLFSIIFYFAGVLIEKSERNYFIGIRTPWTLADERVWKETANIGGKLYKICGGICLIGLIFPTLTFYFVVIPVILVSIFCFFYSYVSFRKFKH